MPTLLAHEWLAPHGGSENVFEQLAATLPDAVLQCLWNDAADRFGTDVQETWLAKSPLRRSKAISLPFMSSAWSHVDVRSFDRVVVSSHAFAHHLAGRAARQGLSAFAYVHTPARYVWSPELDERGRGGAKQLAAKILQSVDLHHVDQRVSYAANSDFVRQRIANTWGVDSTVIYPPANVGRIQAVDRWEEELTLTEDMKLKSLPEEFVLGASRFVEYKRLDLTIRTGEALKLPVVLAGAGPQENALRELATTARVPVIFTGRVSDQLLYSLYQRATLFVFMAIEDFGIMPVEAMAAGTPVLVNEVGGAAESVSLLNGGAAVQDDASAVELKEAAARALQTDVKLMTSAAAQLDSSAFQGKITDWIEGKL